MKIFADLYPHEASLASGLASLDGRLTSLEEWASRPASTDFLADTLNVTRAINLQGEDITASRITGMETDIANLANSKITIAGTSVSLGGSIAASTIKSAMSFSSLSFTSGAFSSTSAYNTNSAVTLKIPTTTAHISESGNLYFTNARAVSACSGTYQTVTNTDKAEQALATALASLDGRITAIEEWLKRLTADELLAQVINIVKALNLGGVDIHLNSDGCVQIDGDLCATGGISCRS